MLKKFKTKNFSLSIIGVLLLVFLLALFCVDVGINSKRFIEKDFISAFTYRITGDCDAFAQYINQDIDQWKSDCEKEKAKEVPGIRNFRVQAVSHKFASDKAFLQVELTRGANLLKDGDFTYSVTYEMQKVGFGWKIDQIKK